MFFMEPIIVCSVKEKKLGKGTDGICAINLWCSEAESSRLDVVEYSS